MVTEQPTELGDITGDPHHPEVTLDSIAEPLRGLIQMSDERACEIFREKGHMIPQWRAITANKEFMLIADPPAVDKDVCAVLVRALLEIKEATAVVFTDEAWKVVFYNEGKPLTPEQQAETERINREGASKHPQRREAIIFVCEDGTGLYHGERDIIRPAHAGAPAKLMRRNPIGPASMTASRSKAKLGPLRLYLPSGSEGRFVSWLPAKGRA